MLDNFSPDTVKRAISLLKQSKILIEISGSINEYNIDKYAIKGVSAISSGAVTMKASSLDISLNFI